MPVRSVDDQIDDLYRLPPAAFTSARDTLVRTAGPRAAEVKRLQKPHAAAWVVNQLYWRERVVFDRLAKASADLRAAHVRQVSGKKVDLAAAETRHRNAMDEARRVASMLLGQANLASPAVFASVDRTLEAVPSPEIAGRLVRPVDPVGFGLLAGLMDSADRRRSTRALADVALLPATDRRRTPAGVGPQAKKEAARQRQERARLDGELKSAVAVEHDAMTAFAKARQAVERADAKVEQLEAALRAARADADQRRNDLERARAVANDTAAARITADRRRRELGD